MDTMLENDLGEMYRQRGRWFLLLGALLGGIIALITAFGFWLENWGNHIGGGPGEDAHDISVGLAVGLTVVVIVIALLVWRARILLTRANSLESAALPSAALPPAAGPPSPVNAAVAAWTSSALRPHTRDDTDSATHNIDRSPTPLTRQPRVDSTATPEERLRASTATELTVGSNSSDQTLAEIIRTVGSAGVEADELWSAAGPQGDQVHLVIRSLADTDARLVAAGLHVIGRRDVVLIEFGGRPGAAADIFRRLTEAGVRVSSAQIASSTRLVIASDDPDQVIEVLS